MGLLGVRDTFDKDKLVQELSGYLALINVR